MKLTIKNFDSKNSKKKNELSIKSVKYQMGGSFIFDSHNPNRTGIYYGVIDYINDKGETIIKKKTNIIKLIIFKDSKQLKWNEILDLWKHNNAFIDFFVSLLISSNFNNFFWECNSVDLKNLKKKLFECYLIESKHNFGVANPSSFKEYLNTSHTIVSFYNLKKDCLLIVPNYNDNDCKSNYLNIYKFIKFAPRSQIHSLFNQISIHINKEIKKNNKIWLNTHGLGVPWLHIRLDFNPKYYTLKEIIR